ncbi:MAG: C40 family peptidase [Candidatus Marinimicrobia bacterium]|jgi:cell wall-associated NlpC family hydrolase|nr:C40 family peptidase [Candidatus Neomarinimicrobiota bacterium]
MNTFKKLLMVIFVLITFACQKGQMKDIGKIINEVQDEFAPDSRTAIFDISYEKSAGKNILKGETNITQAKTELLKKLEESKISVKNEITVLPSKELGERIYGIVNVSVCNIRSEAKNSAELSTQSLLGHPLRLYKKDGYYFVQTTDNYLGWLNDNGFVQMNEAEYKDWQDSKKIIFLKEFGFSYSKPDVNSMRVSDLVMTNLLKYLGEVDEFTKVEYPDGRQAFVLSSQCEFFDKWKKETNPTAENILKAAYRFLGDPYLWGGTSAKMLDCSGFSKTAYFLNGILLPRDASQQVFVGETITENVEEYDKLKPADLVFFGYNKNGKERITHAGIYIGDGKYIHQPGPVKINSFKKSDPDFNPHRYHSFKRGQRILSSINKNGVKLVKDCEFYK